MITDIILGIIGNITAADLDKFIDEHGMPIEILHNSCENQWLSKINITCVTMYVKHPKYSAELTANKIMNQATHIIGNFNKSQALIAKRSNPNLWF